MRALRWAALAAGQGLPGDGIVGIGQVGGHRSAEAVATIAGVGRQHAAGWRPGIAHQDPRLGGALCHQGGLQGRPAGPS